MSRTVTSPFVAHRPEFAAVLGPAPRLERVAEVDAHEGPVYVPGEGALYATTVPQGTTNAIVRIPLDGGEVTVVRADANLANGMALGPDGRLVVCEQGSRNRPARIAVVDRATGAAETLVDAVRGLPLNSPNDVVVRGDGTVWFTDPAYGFLQGFRDAPVLGEHVYRFNPRTGDARAVADGFDKPNGLVFSPDERVLYVGDSGAIHAPGDYDPRRPHDVVAFDVTPHATLVHRRLFAVVTPGFPDGLAVDTTGRLYSSAADGVHVHSAHGELVGEIRLPGAVNFTFGGPNRDVLYVTTDDAVWAASLQARGAVS